VIEEQTSTRSWASMLRISKSQIQTYLICPRKFYFQYVMGAMPEFLPASLPFGSALHAAAATFYRAIKETGTRPALEFIVREFEIEWERAVAGQRLSFKGKTSIESHLGLGKALLQKFYEGVQPRKVEAIEYPFAVPLSDPNTGDPLDVSLVGIIDLIESDDEGNLIIGELKTSSKRYADSQGENQLDGLIYAYAMNKLGFRTRDTETLIRYDVLIKTKSPAFQQIYFNKSPQDFGRLSRWIQEVLQAIDRESFFPNFGWACQNCQFRKRCWSM
jgi:CRISPR/Cas system-associated exonuclease Cas4 (RecB family)